MKENVIDLYIKSKVSQNYLARDDIKCFNFNMATSEGLGIVTSINIVPREEDQKVKGTLVQFARKHNLKLRIHDLADKKEKRKALFKRIRKTPMFIFKGRKFEMIPPENELLALL